MIQITHYTAKGFEVIMLLESNVHAAVLEHVITSKDHSLKFDHILNLLSPLRYAE